MQCSQERWTGCRPCACTFGFQARRLDVRLWKPTSVTAMRAPDAEHQRARAWLLPLLKVSGKEIGFACAAITTMLLALPANGVTSQSKKGKQMGSCQHLQQTFSWAIGCAFVELTITRRRQLVSSAASLENRETPPPSVLLLGLDTLMTGLALAAT